MTDWLTDINLFDIYKDHGASSDDFLREVVNHSSGKKILLEIFQVSAWTSEHTY